MLDLVSFFNTLNDISYCIIKLSSKFPMYNEGDDIDIFCYDPYEMCQKIVEWGNTYLSNGFSIKVNENNEKKPVSVDFMRNKSIHFRFDLYGELPNYKKVLIKPALFESIIEHAVLLERFSNKQKVTIKVPSFLDEMILRYIEFIEWYNIRPDKIKHLDYILKQIDDESKIKFLNKLHHYTALPGLSCYTEKSKLTLKDKLGKFFRLRRR